MSDMWATVTARQLGIPTFPPKQRLPNLNGKHLSWVHSMRTDVADWYWIHPRFGEIQRYVDAGGDMGKVILSHMTHDAGFLNPLWGKDSFLARCERMHEFGVKYVAAPEFSSPPEIPLAVQFYNIYKGAVVATDFYKAGFTVIPHLYWASPQTVNVTMTMWPEDIPYYVVDCQHGFGQRARVPGKHDILLRGAIVARERFRNATVLVYYSAPEALVEYHSVNPRIVPVPSWAKCRAPVRKMEEAIKQGEAQESAQ